MKISELIKALEIQKELHGDIDVLMYARYDGGYYAGGTIDDIKFEQNGAFPCLELLNEEG